MPSKLGKSRYLYLILLHPTLKGSLLICTSHLVWCSHPLTTTWITHGRSNARLKTGYDIILAKLQDDCC